MSDRQKAEAYIAGARKCGIVLAPWRMNGKVVVMQCGRDNDGPNSYSAATDRFLRHPASRYARSLPKGLIAGFLCAELALDPADPLLCEKVNARMRAEDQARGSDRAMGCSA